MNCIIIDDKKNCRLLEEFVGKSTSLNHVGTFTDSDSAKNQLSIRPDIDLVFLDFEIDEMDSLNFIHTLDNKPNVIVVSNNDKYAVKAFDFNVVDYLLKPVTFSRFCKAIDKFIMYYSRSEVVNSEDNEVFIKKGSSLVKLKLKDLIYIEALSNYITLHTINEKFTIHFTMKALENQLPSEIFIRVHRSFLINRRMIQTINEDSLDLIVGDSFINLPIGKSFRAVLLDKIKLMTR